MDILRTTLRDILEYAKAAVGDVARVPDTLYSGETPVLRAVSPLAEGSDRIFAELALALDYELCSPLPFHQSEYEKDFVPPDALESESLIHFRSLLKRARDSHHLTLFQLDGARDHATDAYAAAGRVVLNQSDLLVAVWDGGAPAGLGGTVHTISEAVSYHLPVIWIDAQEPQNWQLVSAESDIARDEKNRARPTSQQKNLEQTVSDIVRAELYWPRSPQDPPQAYFDKCMPRINFAFFWKIFRDLLGGGGLSRPRLTVTDFESHEDEVWSGNAKDRNTPISRWVHSHLWPHYAWADGLADYYADANRTAFLCYYLFAAAAVFVALLPRTAGHRNWDLLCAGSELVFLGFIGGLLWATRKFHWHDKWMECRLLAELIRQLRILVPLGGARPLPRPPVVYHDPSQTWMYWHMRAVARACGIPSAEVTPGYVGECLDYLGRIVGDPNSGQWGFHAQSAERSRRIFIRLRGATLVLLGATVLGVGVRLLFPLVYDGIWERWLLLGSAVLPALGAALEGINNHGEFARTYRRSKAMTSVFQAYATQVHKLQEEKKATLAPITTLSRQITQTMVDEMTEWRTVFSDRAQY